VASENLVDDPGLEAVLISIRQEEAVGAENGRILVLRPAEYSLLQLVYTIKNSLSASLCSISRNKTMSIQPISKVAFYGH